MTGGAPGSIEESLASAPAAVSDRYDALRTWRTERAREDQVPPYIVFDNKTLLHIAERDPSSPRALLEVPGIGPTKLDRYGDELLELLTERRV